VSSLVALKYSPIANAACPDSWPVVTSFGNGLIVPLSSIASRFWLKIERAISKHCSAKFSIIMSYILMLYYFDESLIVYVNWVFVNLRSFLILMIDGI
jgi:hypothetical protein